VGKWFDTAACDEDFLKSAPFRYSYPIDLTVPAEQVWDGLCADRPLSWVRGLDIHWTSPRPFGVASTRVAKVALGALCIQERYFIWEEGQRNAFYAVRTNLPVFARFAEDYLVEPTPTGCLFTWTFAFEPLKPLTPAVRISSRANEALFAAMANDTRRQFGGR